MHRRALLQSFAAVVLARNAAPLPIEGQVAAFGDPEIATLRAMAEVVLPRAAGAAARDQTVASFVAWHRNYKEGAERGHSYGSSTIAQPSGPAPAARYPEQFAALDAAARARGAASFAALDVDARRLVIESALDTPQPVTRLPARPTGANLVADFAGFYFNSPAAWDLCYGVDIGRDRCRSLDGSDQMPPRLGGRDGAL